LKDHSKDLEGRMAHQGDTRTAMSWLNNLIATL